MGRFVTLKINQVKKKLGAKNRVVVIKKEKKQSSLFSFRITMTRFFCTLLFLDLIFFQFQTLKKYQVDLIN
jgi:hypothetical protein